MARVTFEVVALEPPASGFGAWETKHVPSATVKAMDIKSREVVKTCTTDSKGECAIDLPTSPTLTREGYLVQAKKKGYNPSGQHAHDFSADHVKLHLKYVRPVEPKPKPQPIPSEPMIPPQPTPEPEPEPEPEIVEPEAEPEPEAPAEEPRFWDAVLNWLREMRFIK